MHEANAFWQFSLTVYASPGVADECLALQDSHDLNVNVLLFCAWAGHDLGVALVSEDIAAIARVIADWDAKIVKPLRAARRAMKAWPQAASLREKLKAQELEAERLEQGMLYELARQHWPAGDSKRSDLVERNIDALVAPAGLKAADATPALIRAAAGLR